MRHGSFTSVTGRAIVGAIALYALLLQGFLTAATPAAAFVHDGQICALDRDAGANGQDAPIHHDHQCCQAVQAGTVAPPPAAIVLAGPLPPREAAIVWRPEAAIPRTGPPVHAHSARGPPSA